MSAEMSERGDASGEATEFKVINSGCVAWIIEIRSHECERATLHGWLSSHIFGLSDRAKNRLLDLEN
jgi:hypothetical protein